MCRFVNKVFSGSNWLTKQQYIISYKKRFEEETAIEKYVQNAMIEITFVTNLMKLFFK